MENKLHAQTSLYSVHTAYKPGGRQVLSCVTWVEFTERTQGVGHGELP